MSTLPLQIDPQSDLAETIVDVFRTMGHSQREWQDRIGFGDEGHRLRSDVAVARGHLEPTDPRRLAAESNLRNYYHAKLDLIVTEVAEAVEELRHGHQMDETYYPTKGDPDSPFEKGEAFGPFKPEGIPSELADVVIRVWSLIGEVGIDLGPIIVEKLNYNATRAERHGGKAI
jgi:NTP pyrophosphatase (non-canonical NTP hydrolase)